MKRLFKEWTFVGSLTTSGLPAAIYALQNSLLQISYKNLDSLTFSMLNQTKLFFTALFTYIILGYVILGLQLGCKWISLLAEILAALVNICVIEWLINYNCPVNASIILWTCLAKCTCLVAKIHSKLMRRSKNQFFFQPLVWTNFFFSKK